MSELYEVVVVRHGTRTTKRSDVFLNHHFYDESDAPHAVDYYFWIIRNESRSIIVDTGFSPAAGAARNRTILIEAATAYREVGVDVMQPHQVIVTHAHYDHIGNLGLFANSPVLISQAEFDFWQTELATKYLIAYFSERDELEELRSIKRDGRLTTFTGSIEIAPGIEVIEVGGHTPGQAMVRVPTRDGVVLLASDAVHFLEEIERDMPFISATDLPGMYAGFQRVRDMVAAGTVDIVIPGHDAAALDGLEPLRGELAGHAAIIGRMPS